ncbi:protein ALTERED XYLOGLUCAN 9 [Silene latifolia]|uniref:protein ALTERED XYLOGLUCAN 9 n=1 Tax=Silene latifolia TaxID=37657 RepID=UPI003D774EFE
MLGAVQLGGLAACIVVLVPMGLAGWHLSRNKMLFFSGALFISLAIAVHLSPYFPSLPDFFPSTIVSSSSSSSSSSSLVLLDNPESCINLLHKIQWNNRNSVNLSDLSWKWAQFDQNVLACDFHKLGRNDIGDLLNGSWVMVAGDSQARLFALSFLQMLLVEEEMVGVRNDLFKRHSDYQLVVDRIGFKLDFIWAPYAANLSHLVVELSRNKSSPDVVVMGCGLWDMLHITNATHYSDSLHMMNRAVMSLLVPVSPKSQPHLFWLGMPTLINSMLNTEEKREKMTDIMQFSYDQGLHGSKLLRPAGPFVLLDIRSLSESCGVRCTEDGMHYDGAVYQVSVHIMLNVFLYSLNKNCSNFLWFLNFVTLITDAKHM